MQKLYYAIRITYYGATAFALFKSEKLAKRYYKLLYAYYYNDMDFQHLNGLFKNSLYFEEHFNVTMSKNRKSGSLYYNCTVYDFILYDEIII